MEDSKIVLKNYQNSEKFKCFFTGKEFDIKNEAAFFFQDQFVSPAEAIRRGFSVDPNGFKLPAGVNDRTKVSQYIQDVLGIKRTGNTELYFKTWKALSEGLDQVDYDELRPHSNR